MIDKMLRSMVDHDRAQIFVCDLSHRIVFMNKATIARNNAKGRPDMTGRSIFDCHKARSNNIIEQVVEWFKESPDNNMIFLYHLEEENEDLYMVALRDEDGTLIGYYQKHECRTWETAKPYDFSSSLI